MQFLDDGKITVSKITKYPDFERQFIEPIDVLLCQVIMNDKSLNPQVIQVFKTSVMINLPTNGQLLVIHEQKYKIGRFNGKNSIIPNARLIKHTLMYYGGWKDLDMIKGHPSIACAVFKGIIELPAINYYINNFDAVVEELSKYYKTEDDADKLTAVDVKYLHNMMVYGGSQKTWLRHMHDGNPKKCSVGKKIIGYGDDFVHHELVMGFRAECLKIAELVYKLNPSLVKKLKKRVKNGEFEPKYETQSRVVSYFFQIIENDILYIAYQFLVSKGIITPFVCGLEYDGLCFPKSGVVYDDDTIITELNNHIVEKTNLNITFKFKGYTEILHDSLKIRNETFGLSEAVPCVPEMTVVESEAVDKPSSQDIFDELVIPFEEKHCKILNRSLFIKKTDDDNILMTERQILTSYKHMQCGFSTMGLPVCFISKWLSFNDDINMKDDIGVYPKASLCPKNIYNMWIPFETEKYGKTGYIEKIAERDVILQHIMILCGHNKTSYDYLIGWIAMLIQHPEVKTTHPMLIANQGAGKTSLIELFRRMLGDKKVFESSTPSRDVWGNFNSRMKNAFLVNLSELSSKETKGFEDQFKALITDSPLNINEKGIAQYEIKSPAKYITTTNNQNPIKTTDDERRHGIIRSSDELIGNKPYFDTFYKSLDDVNVIRTIYDYFKEYDLSSYDYKLIPKTEHHKELMKLSISQEERWIEYMVLENQRVDEVVLTSQEIYIQFTAWSKIYKPTYQTTVDSLIVKIGFLKLEGITKKKTSTHTKTVFNINLLMKHFNEDDELETTDDDVVGF